MVEISYKKCKFFRQSIAMFISSTETVVLSLCDFGDMSICILFEMISFLNE